MIFKGYHIVWPRAIFLLSSACMQTKTIWGALGLGLGFVVCACAPAAVQASPRAEPIAEPIAKPAAHVCTLQGLKSEAIGVPEAGESEIHLRFDIADAPYLWETAETSESRRQFHRALQTKLGREPEARYLIERQRAIFARMSSEWSGEATNATMLLEGKAGTIRPIGCLEAMLWERVAERFAMLEHPTEFGAFVLRRQGQVRVYFSNADLVGQKIRRTVMDLVEADRAAGFLVFAHLHNHPFLFDRKVGDRAWTVKGTEEDIAGALAPSMTDVQFYKNLRESHGVEEAWVTNGLETAHFRAEEFGVLTGPKIP